MLMIRPPERSAPHRSQRFASKKWSRILFFLLLANDDVQFVPVGIVVKAINQPAAFVEKIKVVGPEVALALHLVFLHRGVAVRRAQIFATIPVVGFRLFQRFVDPSQIAQSQQRFHLLAGLIPAAQHHTCMPEITVEMEVDRLHRSVCLFDPNSCSRAHFVFLSLIVLFDDCGHERFALCGCGALVPATIVVNDLAAIFGLRPELADTAFANSVDAGLGELYHLDFVGLSVDRRGGQRPSIHGFFRAGDFDFDVHFLSFPTGGIAPGLVLCLEVVVVEISASVAQRSELFEGGFPFSAFGHLEKVDVITFDQCVRCVALAFDPLGFAAFDREGQ